MKNTHSCPNWFWQCPLCSTQELITHIYILLSLSLCLQGFLSSPYTATYYKLAQRHADVPRMTEKQYEALRLFNALALSDKLRLDLMLQPGDIQLLSNHTQLHTRSAFVDHPVR